MSVATLAPPSQAGKGRLSSSYLKPRALEREREREREREGERERGRERERERRREREREAERYRNTEGESVKQSYWA